MPRSAPQMPARLVEAAFALFSEHGFNEVSVEQIAARAGVTKGSFYSHFSAKHEIVLAACGHYYRTYQQRVHAELAPVTDPVARLCRMVEFSVHTCVVDRNSRIFTTEIFALSLQDEAVRAGWAQFYDTVREMYFGLVNAAQAAGQVQLDDPRAAVDLMLAALEGVKQRAAFEPHVSDPQEQHSIVKGLLGILGVRTDGAPLKTAPSAIDPAGAAFPPPAQGTT